MTDREKKRLHRKTIKNHRKYVRKMCWKMGLFWQGLVHDLSKYSRQEFAIYKYVTGNRSPHANMRDELGYSDRWMLHYHKNKHHYQYWIDFEDWPDKVIPIKMPYKYIIEMVCDMVGAGMAYSKEKWTSDAPWNYYINCCKGKRLMHTYSEYLLQKLLWNIKEQGLDYFIKWYNENKQYLIKNYNANNLDY